MMNLFRQRMSFIVATACVAAALVSACGGENPQGLLTSAKQFIENRDTKAAIIQLKNALQLAPENAEARYLLGDTLLETGEAVSAEKELRKAKDLNYPNERVISRLAQAMLETGQSEKLIKEFAATELGNRDAVADLAATVGFAYLNMTRSDDARKAFATALVAKPEHAMATLGEARLKAANGDLAGATGQVESVLVKSPALLDALFLKAELFALAKDREGVSKVYESILAAHPNNVRAHYSRIMLSLSQQQVDLATSQLAAMTSVAPQSLQTLYLQALVSLTRKNLPAARESAQQVLKIAPNFLPGQLVAGEVEYRLNSFSQAEDHLRKVLAGAPGNVAALRILTAAYLRDGQPIRAMETLTPLLRAGLEDSGLVMLAGEVYLNNNNMVEAEKYFAKAAALNKGSAMTHARFGQVLYATGDTNAGMRELEAAVEMDSSQYQADVLLIAAYLRRNEADNALAAIAKLEKKQPKNPLTHYLRAGAMLLKGDMAACRTNLEHALELDSTYFPAALTLARLDIQDKKWDMAKQRFEKILEKDPKNPQALLALAQARSSTGAAPKDVIALIDQAVSGNPSKLEPRLTQIRYYLKSGDSKKAAAVAQDALVAIPDNPAILDALGIAQQGAGETNQAIATINKMVALRPKAPEPLLRLASFELADKRTDSALKTLRNALELKPDLLEAQLGIIAIHDAGGRTAEALAMAKTIQQQRPKEVAGYLAEGNSYAQQKKWKEAVAAYRGGLTRLHSSDLAVRVHAAMIGGEHTADAEKFSSEWMRANPKDTHFLSYLAGRNLNDKQYAQAVRQYRSIIAVDPKNPMILNNLAWASGQIKDPKAIEYAEQANAIRPNEPAILDTLAMLLVDRGESARAIEMLRKATALAPNAWTIRVDLVKTLAKAGQRETARKELEPLLNLDEGNPARSAALEQFKDQ